MRIAFCFFMALLALSCNNFELKKLSSEDILKEELKHMDWQTVDVYPTFESCAHTTEAGSNDTCFSDTLSSVLYEYFTKQDLATLKLGQDTLFFNFYITDKGAISLDTIKGVVFPEDQYTVLTCYTSDAISQLPQSYPAQKRGVPVATKLSLPVIVVEE